MLGLILKLIDLLSGGKLRLGFAAVSLVGVIVAQFLPKESTVYAWIVALTGGLASFVPNLKPTIEKLQAKMTVAKEPEVKVPEPEPTSLPPGVDQKVDGHSEEAAEEYRNSISSP